MRRQRVLWEFNYLIERGFFDPGQLRTIRKVIEEVKKTKEIEKISFDDHPFEVYIFPNGNILLTKKDKDIIIPLM